MPPRWTPIQTSCARLLQRVERRTLGFRRVPQRLRTRLLVAGQRAAQFVEFRDPLVDVRDVLREQIVHPLTSAALFPVRLTGKLTDFSQRQSERLSLRIGRAQA